MPGTTPPATHEPPVLPEMLNPDKTHEESITHTIDDSSDLSLALLAALTQASSELSNVLPHKAVPQQIVRKQTDHETHLVLLEFIRTLPNSPGPFNIEIFPETLRPRRQHLDTFRREEVGDRGRKHYIAEEAWIYDDLERYLPSCIYNAGQELRADAGFVAQGFCSIFTRKFPDPSQATSKDIKWLYHATATVITDTNEEQTIAVNIPSPVQQTRSYGVKTGKITEDPSWNVVVRALQSKMPPVTTRPKLLHGYEALRTAPLNALPLSKFICPPQQNRLFQPMISQTTTRTRLSSPVLQHNIYGKLPTIVRRSEPPTPQSAAPKPTIAVAPITPNCDHSASNSDAKDASSRTTSPGQKRQSSSPDSVSTKRTRLTPSDVTSTRTTPPSNMSGLAASPSTNTERYRSQLCDPWMRPVPLQQYQGYNPVMGFPVANQAFTGMPPINMSNRNTSLNTMNNSLGIPESTLQDFQPGLSPYLNGLPYLNTCQTSQTPMNQNQFGMANHYNFDRAGQSQSRMIPSTNSSRIQQQPPNHRFQDKPQHRGPSQVPHSPKKAEPKKTEPKKTELQAENDVLLRYLKRMEPEAFWKTIKDLFGKAETASAVELIQSVVDKVVGPAQNIP